MMGAASATTANSSTTPPPNSTPLFRGTQLGRTPVFSEGSASIAPLICPCGAGTLSATSAMRSPQPRVQRRVRQIDQQVHQQEHRPNQQHRRLQLGIIPL